MAAKPVAIFISDSWGNGAGSLSSVPAADFSRWTGTTWPTSDPRDVTIPDVEMLTPTLPYGVTVTANVASATASTVVTTTSVFAATDKDKWLYVKSGTGQGHRRQILAYVSGTSVSVTPNWAVTPDDTSVIELWTDAHTFGQGFTFAYDAGSAPFTLGETLTFSTPATAVILNIYATGAATGFIVTGPILTGTTPVDNDTFSGGTSGSTGAVNGGVGATQITDADANTTTLRTYPESTAWVNTANTFVIIASGAGAGAFRRVVSASGDTVVVTPSIAALTSGICLRQLTGANAVNTLSQLSTTANNALRPLRFFQDAGKTCYSNAGVEYPNWYGQPAYAPAFHSAINAINHIPEALWWMRQHFDGKLYCVNVAAAGATMAPQPIGTTFQSISYSWTWDITTLDWKPGATTGLYTALILQLTALKALLLAQGDTPDVRAVFTCIGTNDALDDDKAAQFQVGMGTLRDTLRTYLASNGMSTLGANQIPWIMSTGADSRVYANTVDAAVIALADDDPYSGYVESGSFSTSDQVHPNQTGSIQLGKAFYDTWVAVQEAASASAAQAADRPSLSSLRTKVKRRFEGSTSSNAATNTRVDMFINDALREVYLTLGHNAWFLRVAETVALSATYPNTVTLKRPVRDVIRIESSTNPGVALTWKGISLQDNGKTQITVMGAPLGSYIIHYMVLPQDLVNDGDTPLLPIEYCELVVMLATKRLAESSGNAALGGYYAAEIQRLWSFVKRDCLRRDRYRQESMTALPSFDEWSSDEGWRYP